MTLTPKHTAWVFALLMSGTMAAIVSAVVTAVNTGIDSGFVNRWLASYIVAWPVAFVSLFSLKTTVMAIARKITAHSE